MKRALFACLLLVVTVGGCSPASKAQKWAAQAVEQDWQAQYRIVFHQADQDLEMTVREDRGTTLVLDIAMPSGSLHLEYTETSLRLDLDQGSLNWEDPIQQPPYYTLYALAQQIVAEEPGRDGEWACAGGYRVKFEEGIPVEVQYQSEWTLYIEQYVWKETEA